MTVGQESLETVLFAGLPITFDSTVLRPRSWTSTQSLLGAHLLQVLPAGAVLELCAGAGQIGLRTIREQPRPLVAVDSDAHSCEFARLNADELGLGPLVDVRCAPLEEALLDGEEFALILADPPWVRHRDIGRFPEDPVFAIDGGPDGLDVARACVRVIARHLMPDGAALLQLGDVEQAAQLELELSSSGLASQELREIPGSGVLLRLRRTP